MIHRLQRLHGAAAPRRGTGKLSTDYRDYGDYAARLRRETGNDGELSADYGDYGDFTDEGAAAAADGGTTE